ncbi:MAG: hypothetical protein ABIH86_04820 [Planctomycetota bacterium]
MKSDQEINPYTPKSENQDNWEIEEIEIIESLYFYIDNLFHTRVNFFLVVQALFLMATLQIWEKPQIVMWVSIFGIFTTVLFSYSNIKLYWRVQWLINRMKKSSRFYKKFIELHNIENINLKPQWLIRYVSSDDNKYLKPPSTGWIFSWGLFFIAIIGWCIILVASIRNQNDRDDSKLPIISNIPKTLNVQVTPDLSTTPFTIVIPREKVSKIITVPQNLSETIEKTESSTNTQMYSNFSTPNLSATPIIPVLPNISGTGF